MPNKKAGLKSDCRPFRQRRLPPRERILQDDQVETDVVEFARWALVDGHVLELKNHVQLASSRIGVQPRLFRCDARRFADCDELTVAAGENLPCHLGQVVMHVRPIERVGLRYRPADPTAELWWSEGATIFFGDLLVRRAGLPAPVPKITAFA